MTTTYPTTNTNTMTNNANIKFAFDNAVPSYNPYQQQSQQQYQQQSQSQQALVPAIAPGNTNIYNNYAVFSTTSTTSSDDLIDFGHAVSDGTTSTNNSTGYGGNSTYYSSQQSRTSTNSTAYSDDDLISFDNNTNNNNMSFASAPVPTHQPAAAAAAANLNLKALQERDDEFVMNLPRELIEEQERILAQIQQSNISRSSRSQVVSHSNPTTNNNDGQQLYQQRFDASLPDASLQLSQLPQEVHPKKYQMKDARKVKTAASATTGAVVGGLMFGPFWPVGAVAGAAVGGYAGKVISREGERKQQRKWDKKNFNDYTGQGKADVQSENVTFA